MKLTEEQAIELFVLFVNKGEFSRELAARKCHAFIDLMAVKGATQYYYFTNAKSIATIYFDATELSFGLQMLNPTNEAVIADIMQEALNEFAEKWKLFA